MAQVTITVPPAATADVLAAFQAAYPAEWAAAQTAGQTPAQFAQARLAAYVEMIYRQFKIAQGIPPAPPPAGVT